MLTAIKKIKGLGVFGDYASASDLPEFKRFNLVYGENGSGKTTLSRLFASLATGKHPEYPDLDFTITTDSGSLTSGQAYARKIRVFNSDYVDANIGAFDSPFPHILIIGEANKALAEQVKQEQATYDARAQLAAQEQEACEKFEQDKGKVFSAIAKTIGEATSGSTLRSYRKQNAEAAFAKLATPKLCTEEELQGHRATVRQDQADAVPPIVIPTVPFAEGEEPRPLAAVASDFSSLVQQLTLKTAQSAALARLAEKPDISRWVEAGLALHRHHDSQRCEFCDQSLPAERMKALAEHFSTEDQHLKAEIEGAQTVGARIADVISAISLPPKAGLYAELRAEYETATAAVEAASTSALESVAELQGILTKKVGERATAYATSASLDVAGLVASLRSTATLVERHNRKTGDFDAEKVAARDALETHYLSTVADEVAGYTTKINEKKESIRRLTDGHADQDDPRSLAAILASIAEKKAQVSSAHAGGAALTQMLTDFLGRTDLTFDSGDEGYRVRRRGKIAKRLSEGEKTAIAFIYFIVQLRDQDFDLAEGIVVIDDPISSLDSSAIYQAFAYLKNAVKDARQVFLLTHNFEFLKLLLNWLAKARKNKAYFMIICAEEQDTRSARLAPLDPLLVDHPTEYHYLFKLLYSFKSDGTIATCYHIPNVARKILETFLEFHVPSNDTIYEKLEATQFDQNKKTAIFKFANDLSHHTGKGFDPALVAETQKNATYLLEMIQAVAPLHYEGLENLAKA